MNVKQITALLTCRVCKGSGLKGSEPCPRCSTEEGRKWGEPGSGIDPDSFAGCCEEEERCGLVHLAHEHCSEPVGTERS